VRDRGQRDERLDEQRSAVGNGGRRLSFGRFDSFPDARCTFPRAVGGSGVSSLWSRGRVARFVCVAAPLSAVGARLDRRPLSSRAVGTPSSHDKALLDVG